MIAQAVLNQFASALGTDGVTFIPAGHPPHRSHQNDLLDARRRLHMVELATAPHPRFVVDDLELHRTEPSYTVETLRLLQRQGKIQCPVPFIIGSDALQGLASWREPKILIEMACFLQAPRPNCAFVSHIEIDGQRLALNTQAIAMPMTALSSTWVRDTVKNPTQGAAALRYYVPELVRQFIQDNHLYLS
jgi:nicotinate-nucleotide adenylyltransferase